MSPKELGEHFARKHIPAMPTMIRDFLHGCTAERAHELWESASRIDGRDVENWLQAEEHLGLR